VKGGASPVIRRIRVGVRGTWTSCKVMTGTGPGRDSRRRLGREPVARSASDDEGGRSGRSRGRSEHPAGVAHAAPALPLRPPYWPSWRGRVALLSRSRRTGQQTRQRPWPATTPPKGGAVLSGPVGSRPGPNRIAVHHITGRGGEWSRARAGRKVRGGEHAGMPATMEIRPMSREGEPGRT